MTMPDVQEKLQRHLDYLTQDESNVSLLLSISHCYRQIGKQDLAQTFLDDAKRLSGLAYWTEQGLLHLDSNQLVLAKDALERALAEQDSPVRRYQLAYCLFRNREFEPALLLLHSDKSQETLFESGLLKARIYQQLQQTDDAVLILENLFALNASHAEIAGLLALLHFDNNALERAELLSNSALAIRPDNMEAQLVRVLLKTLRNEISTSEIESLLVKHPDECRLWFALGTIEMQHMDIAAAGIAFSQATRIWPQFYECWISLAWCQLFQNDLGAAERSYQQAMQADPGQADALAGLALVNALRKDMTSARVYLEKSKALNESCFLAAMTEVIMANEHSPEQAAERLMKALPGLDRQIEPLLNQVLKQVSENEVLH